MAKVILLPAGKTFIIELSENDLERIASVVMEQRSDFDSVLIACFYAGIVKIETGLHINPKMEKTNG